MVRKSIILLALLLLIPASSWSFEVYRNGDVSLSIGYWAQAWYQYLDEYDHDGDGNWDESLNDFMIRRTYFNVKGTLTPQISFFVHYAGDRIGQDGLDKPSVGLGSGLALRDGWVTYKVLGDDLMVQAGRMYIPFTRNYGTTSTKALLTTELDWGQGGIRSGIFYPSKVGRDDGVTLWGNIVDNRLQYRFMVAEGGENSSINPDDRLRFAGRVSLNLFDAETGWFNRGTYLGTKKVLAVGAGLDFQPDLVLNGSKKDYNGYTVDVFMDLPVGENALTAEASYIWIDNAVNGVTVTDLAAGADGDILSAKAGFLFADRVQPFAHAQWILPDAADTNNTTLYGFGCNYYIKGVANKLTAEWTLVDNDVRKVDIITVQAAFGF